MFRSIYSIALMAFLFLSTAVLSTAQAQSDELKKAPDFEVTTIDGETVSLQQSLDENKPMVVYFTASWCPTCAQNWGPLSEVYQEYEDRLNFISISIDPTDTEEVIRNLVEEQGITYPSTSGHPGIMVDFGVPAQATTVGVNRDGFIAFQRNNVALSADEFRELFDRLVSGS